jgi:hypothetical protein
MGTGMTDMAKPQTIEEMRALVTHYEKGFEQDAKHRRAFWLKKSIPGRDVHCPRCKSIIETEAEGPFEKWHSPQCPITQQCSIPGCDDRQGVKFTFAGEQAAHPYVCWKHWGQRFDAEEAHKLKNEAREALEAEKVISESLKAQLQAKENAVSLFEAQVAELINQRDTLIARNTAAAEWLQAILVRRRD